MHFPVFVILATIAPVLNSQCGCKIFQKGINGHLTADCSNCLKVDFKCLDTLEPESLILSGNWLREVPKALNATGFRHLKHLDLSHNNISSLTNFNFGASTHLQSVNISHNLLTDLPNLQCHIRSIDVSFNGLTNMTSLVPLVRTNAKVKGNPILCNCRNSLVKRIYSKSSEAQLQNIECKKNDSGPLRPLSIQCNQEIDNNETNATSREVFFNIIIGVLFGFFIIPFIIVLIYNGIKKCKNKN